MTRTQQRALPFLLADRYRVTRRLGSGQSSEVYAAHDKRMGRSCAIKLLRSDLIGDDGVQRERLEREAHALARLKHESIVSVFDVEAEGEEAWIVMELVDGLSLDLAGVLLPEEAVDVMMRIASALEFAHQKDILHRDIKPANVLRSGDGTVKLADFGIAMLSLAGPGLTMAGTPIGTPSYMPPEQAEGRIDRITPASDIYSMGATLYSLLTGRPPFPIGDDHSAEATLREVLSAEPVAPTEISSDIPAALEAICLKCLARRPQDRFQSAADFRQALEQFQSGEPVLLSRRASVRKLTAAGAVTTMSLVVGTAWWRHTGRGTPGSERDSAVETGRAPARPDQQAGQLAQADAPSVSSTPLPDGVPGLACTLEGHSAPLMSLAFSPDGRTIVSSAEDMTVRFWDVESQHELRQCHPDDSIRIIDTAFSRDGKMLVTGRSLGPAPKVRLIDVESTNVIHEFPGHDSWDMVLCVDISSDSKLIAAISATHSTERNRKPPGVVARVWDRKSGRLVFEKPCGDEPSMVALKILPDNRHLLISTLSGDFGTRLYEIPSQTEVKSYNNSANHARSIATSSDGHFFGLYSSGRLSFFRTQESHVFRSFPSEWCSDFLLTPDDRHLIAAGSQQLQIWNIHTKSIVHEQHSETVRFEKIALSPDGRFLASGGGGTWNSEKRRVVGDGDYTVYVWRLPEVVWPEESGITLQ